MRPARYFSKKYIFYDILRHIIINTINKKDKSGNFYNYQRTFVEFLIEHYYRTKMHVIFYKARTTHKKHKILCYYCILRMS